MRRQYNRTFDAYTNRFIPTDVSNTQHIIIPVTTKITPIYDTK